MKTKFIQKLMYGKYPYSVQIKHDALRFKNIRWSNHGSVLRPVEPFMYNLNDKELNTNQAYMGMWNRDTITQDRAAKLFASWDTFVLWFNGYVASHPDCVGRKRHEGNGITFFTKDELFCEAMISNFPDICAAYSKLYDPALLPIMEKAAHEKTWLLQTEYVDHYPHNEYQYRMHLSWDARDSLSNMIEMFRSYKDADLIRLNSGFNSLLAGTGRLRFPAHILVKTEDTLELIKLALGPSSISQIVEYVLIDDVLQSSSP